MSFEDGAEIATPEVSVVIPCRDGAKTLAMQLRALTGSPHRHSFEVIVADNGSTDGTATIVTSFPDRRVRHCDASRGSGVNVARNDGVAAARGRKILLCDSDDVVHPGWLDAMADALSDTHPVVGGSIDRTDSRGRHIRRQGPLFPSHVQDAWYPVGANCGFMKSVWEALGGFDESFSGGGDEVDFFVRAHLAGSPVFGVPDAVVMYRERPTIAARWRQNESYGRGHVRLAAKFGSVITIRETYSAAAIAINAAALSVLWFSRKYRRSCLGVVAFHIGAWKESRRIPG